MEKENIGLVVRALLDTGYDLKSINYISKGLEIGFNEIQNIQINVHAQTIKELVKAYGDYYNGKESEFFRKMLVDYANEGYPIKYIVDKSHTKEYINFLKKDIAENKDINCFKISVSVSFELNCRSSSISLRADS